VARWVGLLAECLDEFDVAEHHLERALSVNERLRARPWVARTQLDLARVYLGWGRPGHRRRATGLLEEALATTAALGMPTLTTRVRTLLLAQRGVTALGPLFA
jgi:hypothetical protein